MNDNQHMGVEYIPLAGHFHFWCESHERRADHMFIQKIDGKISRMEPHCDPKLGGILLPCKCLKYSGK